MAIGAAIGAAGAALAAGISKIGSGQSKWRRKLSAQEESQMRLNEQNAELNFQYGEQAADAAHQRSLGLLQAETEANSLEAQVADARAAGLSPGLLYGGGAGGTGGSAGGGAMGAGARGQSAEAPDYLEVEAIKNQNKLVAIEAARLVNESLKVKAEKDNIEADTALKNEERMTSEELTPIQKAIGEQEGLSKWIENERKKIEQSGMQGDVESLYNKALGEIHFTKGSDWDKKQALEVAKAFSEVRGQDIINELNTEKKKGYWEELANATKNADSQAQQAAAVKLAAEWSTGEYTNWKTWVSLAKDAVGAVTDIVKIGQ
ncbi:DNA pilot protein [Tortoise microvirus 19]|nr:DNA pilot protein [Tortoise microvirus 19]